MKSITEEMRYRRRLCEYAIKYGVTKAARRHHTNRKFVYRQLKKYDGSVRSLAMRSRKPHRSPNAHTEEELSLIKRILKRNGALALMGNIENNMPIETNNDSIFLYILYFPPTSKLFVF